MVSAGRRVQQALAAVHPEANARLFSDKVASPALVQTAECEDLFVVCWAAAKHSATEAIASPRRSNLTTIYPRCRLQVGAARDRRPPLGTSVR